MSRLVLNESKVMLDIVQPARVSVPEHVRMLTALSFVHSATVLIFLLVDHSYYVSSLESGPITQIAYDSLVECHKKLAPRITAMYLTIQRGMDLRNLHRLMAPLNKHGIPTFSQFGSEEVKHGVLMSIAQAGFKYVGEFYAQTIAKVLSGAKPRDLSQIFEDPPKIALNLEEARIIQWDPPMDVLSAADEIYEKIEVAEGALDP